MTRLRVCLAALIFCLIGVGCVDEPDAPENDYAEHGELSDFAPIPEDGKADGVTQSFNQNHIMTDAFFLDSTAMNASQIQAFLEATPYGSRSWLADVRVGGQQLSTVIAQTSVRHNIHPLMILSRFQVEGSHISKTRHPGTYSANRALGCGCFDGQACQSRYFGIEKQVDCAADTLEKRYNGSVDGSWHWRRGHTATTSDNIRVTPQTHATAALYAYTPWVLRNRGGNWLVWNITKRFDAHAKTLGLSTGGGNSGNGGPAWIGTPCETDNDCSFAYRDNHGFCYDFVDATGAQRGFCSLVCEGYCPDTPGAATTFCIAGDVANVGICASKAEAANNFCADLDGTTSTNASRFIGTSTAPASTANVCHPDTL